MFFQLELCGNQMLQPEGATHLSSSFKMNGRNVFSCSNSALKLIKGTYFLEKIESFVLKSLFSKLVH